MTEVLERIRAGVVATWQRAEKRTRSGGCPMAMSARDLLMGTCLRFDSNDTGAVDASALNKVNALFLVILCTLNLSDSV